ncbi:predicted protein [Streptomyces sp. AA4]|nr:predicted protein [Streptomyces sp. AA4]
MCRGGLREHDVRGIGVARLGESGPGPGVCVFREQALRQRRRTCRKRRQNGLRDRKVNLQVVINKDMPGPDPQAGERTCNGFVTDTVTVYGKCLGHGKYYTETHVLGTVTKVQSERVELC